MATNGNDPWRWIGRLLPALVLVAIVVAAYASGVMGEISLAGLARHRAVWAAAVAAHPAQAFGAFIILYGILAGAGLPVAMLLSLGAGLVFGAVWGGTALWVGSVLSAMPGYFAAHSALGPWVARHVRKNGRVGRLVKELSSNGFSFVLTIRLMPFIPFFAVNIASGLAAVPVRSYALATAIGAIPTSFIYASLGAGLGASLDARSISLAVRSPGVLLPLAALALMALISAVWQARRQSVAA